MAGDTLSANTVGFLGDFKRNGLLDAGDIDSLRDAVNTPEDLASYDLNGDAQMNTADYRIWVEDIKQTYFGDANLDRIVNSADLNALAINWRNDASSWASGDFTGDGKVDANDLNVLALNWLATSLPTSVPEPASLIAIVLAIPFWVRLRRKRCVD